MSRKQRFSEGDVMTCDGDCVLRGHLTLEEYNEVADECDSPHATAVRHYYARSIPAQPDDEYSSYIHDWGNRPSRGAFAATEAVALVEEVGHE